MRGSYRFKPGDLVYYRADMPTQIEFVGVVIGPAKTKGRVSAMDLGHWKVLWKDLRVDELFIGVEYSERLEHL